MCASKCAPCSSTVELCALALAHNVARQSTRAYRRLVNVHSRHNARTCVNYDDCSRVYSRRPRTIEPCVQVVLVSAAVVLVFVTLWCVCAPQAPTSLDTASTCLAALVVLTVATRCYAAVSHTGPALSQPAQTFPTPASNRSTPLRLVQSVLPSSITRCSRTPAPRDYLAAAKRKCGRRVKRASTDLGHRRRGNSSDHREETVFNNVTAESAGNLNNSAGGVVHSGVGADSSGPDNKQSTVRPMPSAHDEPTTHTVSDDIGGGIETGGGTASGGGSDTGGGNRFLALVISAALLTVTLGLITCVVNYYRGDTSTSLGTLPTGNHLQPHSPADEQHIPTITQPITAPMLSVVSASAAGMDAAGGGAAGRLHRHHVTRELAVQRDRQVRLHSVHTDLQLDLPPSIALPDGEELPYGSSARLHIRDAEQESEIYQKCIRPPPNRTVFESESPPPYRSSSAGLLGGSTTTSTSAVSEWSTGSAPFVVRCHSMSSTTTAKRTLEAAAAQAETTVAGQKADFLQRTVKIFTGKKNATTLPQPAPTLPGVVVPTAAMATTGVRTTRRVNSERAKHQGNV